MVIDIKIPQSWDDLTESQLRQIALNLEQFREMPESFQKSAKSINRLYAKIIKTLLSKNNFIKRYFAFRQIPPANYLDHLNFVLLQNNRQKFPSAFYIATKKYVGPSPRLQNLTIKEFSFADAMYYQYKKTKNIHFLNLLCATLYRPVDKLDKTGIDKRKPFNKITTQQAAPKISRLLQSKKLAILYAYEGSRNYIVSLYPTIFPKSETTQEEAYTPFGKLLHYKIGFDPHKIKDTEMLNLHDFFSIYENELKELQNQK